MRLGIAYRINLIVLVTVLVLGGSLGAYFVYEEDRALRVELERRVRMLGEQVAAYLGREVLGNAPGEVEGILRSVRDPEIAYVLVKSATGEVVAGRWNQEVRSGVSEFQYPIFAEGARAAEAPESFGIIEAAPGSLPIGSLSVGIDLSHLRAHRQELIRRTIVATVAAALTAALAGFYLVRVVLLRSLSPLLDGIRGVAGGDLSRRVELRGRRDELGDIGQAFNDMAGQLAQTIVTKADLEATVARRTAELTQALEERRRAERTLEDSEARIRLLLDSTAESIYGIGNDGLCSFCNPACLRALGYSTAEELIGRNIHDLVHHSTTEGARVGPADCPILRTIHDGKGYHSEDELLWRADGTSFPVELWSFPMVRDGMVAGSVVTFFDITERKRLESELLKMRKLESLGVLAGGIAHDFNNLLMGILGNVAVAKEDDLGDGERRTLLAEAEQAALRARNLTQQLLTFSKGGAPLMKVVAIRSIVEEAARFALSGAAARASFTFESEPWLVDADAGQLGQVVHNLILNAVQAMPAGGTIDVGCENVKLADGEVTALPEGRYVRLTVRDEGHGIPPEHLHRIFDPYFTTKAGGHGLGLASVYSIIQRHGGHVTVTSALGKGTCFTVHLPASARSAVTPPPAREPRSSTGGRVLVMDDEPAVRKVATAMLDRLGYEVEAAADGNEALEKARTARAAGRPFDVLLMDLTVPGGMGGAEAAERLPLADPEAVAVATSGYSNDPVLAACRDFGFVAAVAKPYTPADLGHAIAEAMLARKPRTPA